MTRNQKIILGVLAGAAVAGGIVYILSNQGTDLRNEIRDRGRKLADNLEDVVGKAKRKYKRSYEDMM